MSTARTYNPFDLAKPVLRLGDHGEWKLGDLNDARHRAASEIGERFEALSDTDATVSDLAELVGELAEALCEKSTGLRDLIVDLADASKHADDAIGVHAITGLMRFFAEWMTGEAEAGND